jgi:predicted amidohydrolase
MAERFRGDVYNAAPLIGPEGIIGTARKLYLARLHAKTSGKVHDESLFFKPGERIAIFDTEFGRLGVLICLDNRHPEIAHAQAIAGCWLKLRPSAGPWRKGQPDVNPLDLGRGIENQVGDCYINIVGDQAGTWYRGGSCVIVGAQGVKATASCGPTAREEVLEYELSPEDVYKARGQWRNIREIRPDLMHQLWEVSVHYQYGTGRLPE